MPITPRWASVTWTFSSPVVSFRRLPTCSPTALPTSRPHPTPHLLPRLTSSPTALSSPHLQHRLPSLTADTRGVNFRRCRPPPILSRRLTRRLVCRRGRRPSRICLASRLITWRPSPPSIVVWDGCIFRWNLDDNVKSSTGPPPPPLGRPPLPRPVSWAESGLPQDTYRIS
jgi:hypothetical protein